jgi:uncharacterized protein (DUF4415 family)
MLDGKRANGDGAEKTKVTLELSPEVLEKLRALGPDWEDRLSDLIREALDDHAEGEA